MKNRTIYEVLDTVMQDYMYSIQKTGNKVEIKGSVFIPRIDVTVTHEKVFYYTQDDNGLFFDDDKEKLGKTILTFKEELRGKVASVIKDHKEELTDDDAMIDKLLYEIKSLKKYLAETEEELKAAREKITALEIEIATKPSPTPYTPWPNYPSPWSTGITLEPYVGDKPDWLDNGTITCDDHGCYESTVTGPEGINMNGGSVHHTATDKFFDDLVAGKFIKPKRTNNKKRNGGEF